MNLLDRPIWTSLVTRNASFARGAPPAMAYRPDVEPFAAVEIDSEESLEALSKLHIEGDNLLLLQRDLSPPLPGLELMIEAVGVQMVSERGVDQPQLPEFIQLDDADAPEMRALAELTKPGPFRAATHQLGQFWGIRQEGKLVAMAGERMKVPGMSELSGVCTHPDWRGHGYARKLSAFVTGQIQARGEAAFLHAYADNQAAIGLYEQLGYSIRCEMAVQSFGKR